MSPLQSTRQLVELQSLSPPTRNQMSQFYFHSFSPIHFYELSRSCQDWGGNVNRITGVVVPISIKQVLPLQRAELLCGIDYGLALTRVQRTLEVTLYVPPLILQSHYYVGTRIHACSLSFSAEKYLLSVDLLSLSKALAPLQSWACYPHLWWWYLLTATLYTYI